MTQQQRDQILDAYKALAHHQWIILRIDNQEPIHSPIAEDLQDALNLTAAATHRLIAILEHPNTEAPKPTLPPQPAEQEANQ